MFSFLYHFWRKHQKKILILGIFIVIACFLIPHLAVAQGNAPLESPDAQKMEKTLVSFLTIMLEFLQRILWPVLLLIGGLMKNDILFSAGMEEQLRIIWSAVRDLVNILFVLVLLFIAFYNVVGAADQNYQVKAILPKFVVALIAVNFSFLGVKIILDTVSIVSTAIFSLPYSVTADQGKLPENDKVFIEGICKSIYGKTKTSYEQAIKDSGDSALCAPDSFTFSGKGKEFFSRFNANNAAMVLAVNLAKISDLDKVFPQGKNLTLSKLLINQLFSIIFYIIYGTAFIALLAILIARLVVLWITIVLSPLMVLKYVLPESLKNAIGGEGSKLTETFIQNAIAPLPIAFVMTLGFVMLKHFDKADLPSVSLTSSTLGTSLLVSGLGTLQDLVVGIALVGFIWKGVFDAADKTAAAGFTQSLKGGVESAGKFVGGLWKHTPLFPVMVGEHGHHGEDFKLSLAAMGNLPGELQMQGEQKARDDSRRLMEMLTGRAAGAKASDIDKARDFPEIQQKIRNAEGEIDTKPVQQSIARWIKTNPSPKGGRFVIPRNLTDDSGKKIIEKDFYAKMEKGEISKATMKEFMDINTKNIKAEPEKPATQPDGISAPAAQPTVNQSEANKLVNNPEFAVYQKALGDAGKKLMDYRGASMGSKREDALKNSQKELELLQKLENSALDFRTKVMNAVDVTGVEQAIEGRRQELDRNGIKTKADQDLIITGEIMNSQAVKDKVAALPGMNLDNVQGVNLRQTLPPPFTPLPIPAPSAPQKTGGSTDKTAASQPKSGSGSPPKASASQKKP